LKVIEELSRLVRDTTRLRLTDKEKATKRKEIHAEKNRINPTK